MSLLRDDFCNPPPVVNVIERKKLCFGFCSHIYKWVKTFMFCAETQTRVWRVAFPQKWKFTKDKVFFKLKTRWPDEQSFKCTCGLKWPNRPSGSVVVVFFFLKFPSTHGSTVLLLGDTVLESLLFKRQRTR